LLEIEKSKYTLLSTLDLKCSKADRSLSKASKTSCCLPVHAKIAATGTDVVIGKEWVRGEKKGGKEGQVCKVK
jgi:hypothetical protein